MSDSAMRSPASLRTTRLGALHAGTGKVCDPYPRSALRSRGAARKNLRDMSCFRDCSPVAGKAAEEEQLSAPLAEWKLAALRTRPGVVRRPRLYALLDGRAEAALTLVAAPAGYGKTQLLASWIEAHPDLSAAWVSLDAGDSEPRRFWTYVAHAVDRVRSGMARPALSRLNTAGVAVEEAIDELMNGIATFAGKLVIVIDDLHHFTSGTAAHSLAYAVEHMPPPGRIVAATRSDPVIRLGRLRTVGAVAEVRSAQLVFTALEATELIVGQMGIALNADDLELLVKRTEGWPAGLSLAGLWLGELDDPGAQVRSFSGDQRHLADYLVEEVLDALDAETRSFLVRCSVLDRFSGPLCDVTLGVEDSRKRLDELARTILFVVPLDSRGEWYRFHHLFRDLLALELSLEDEDSIRQFHERAAGWFIDHGFVEEALEHTAAAGDSAAIARLLTEQYLPLIRSSRIDLFLNWLEWLPREVLLDNPLLSSAGVLALPISGRPGDERSERFLQIAKLGARTGEAHVKLRVNIVAELAPAMNLVSAVDDCVRSGRRALDLALSGDEELVAGAEVILAYA